MTEQGLLDKVLEALYERLGKPDIVIAPTDSLKSLGLDSLDLVELVDDLQEVTGVYVPSTMFDHLLRGTVEELVTYLEAHKA